MYTSQCNLPISTSIKHLARVLLDDNTSRYEKFIRSMGLHSVSLLHQLLSPVPHLITNHARRRLLCPRHGNRFPRLSSPGSTIQLTAPALPSHLQPSKGTPALLPLVTVWWRHVSVRHPDVCCHGDRTVSTPLKWSVKEETLAPGYMVILTFGLYVLYSMDPRALARE